MYVRSVQSVVDQRLSVMLTSLPKPDLPLDVLFGQV